MTIAFYLPGGVPVYAFTLVLALGAALGLLWVAWRTPDKEVLYTLDVGLLVLLGGLLGGRAAFVVSNWVYYQSHLLEIFAVHHGGYSWTGALAGGVLALVLVAAVKQASLGLLADAMLPLLATLTIAGWLGCWLDGCAYGPRTDQWWGFPAINEWGQTALRLPTQTAGSRVHTSAVRAARLEPRLAGGTRTVPPPRHFRLPRRTAPVPGNVCPLLREGGPFTHVERLPPGGLGRFGVRRAGNTGAGYFPAPAKA